MTGVTAISRMIASALARPAFRKVNISWNMRFAITCVSNCPLVITKTIAETLSTMMITVGVMVMIVPRIYGTMTRKKI